MKDKTKALKIIAPILIIFVIIGIFIFKNSKDNNEELQEQLAIPLTVTSIDMGVLKKNNLPIIIDFGADSCIPCKEMAPVLKKLNEEMQGKAVIQFVDVWKNPDATKDFPVQVIPTQVFYHADGSPYVPSEELEIEFTMYSTKDTNEHIFTVHQGGLTEQQMRDILADMEVTP